MSDEASGRQSTAEIEAASEQLPDGLAGWLTESVGGDLVQLRRHVARREAWVVDVEQPGGEIVEGFLRLERGSPTGGTSRLGLETRIVEALIPTDVPVCDVLARSDDRAATLFARDPGRSDIDHVEDAGEQRAVMADLMRVLARLHTLDLDALGLDDVLGPRPSTPEECGLGEVRAAWDMWSFFLEDYVDPLTTFGIDWLERNLPRDIQRISLVQGDTGPVNFMFQGTKVSSIIDWEMGHYGDPMEDLGSVCLREFWNPSGGVAGLFEIYEQESGLRYDRHAVQFHRVRQNVRDMLSIHYLVANPLPMESHAWYLCYRYLADRATVEAIADNVGVEVTRPDLPDDVDETDDLLVTQALTTIDDDVLPHVGTDMARSRAVDVQRLIRCMDRRRRWGAEMADAERREIGDLLGTEEPSEEVALRSLNDALRAGGLPDEEVVPYLARKAYRDEWLYKPAIEDFYPNRNWSPLD